MSTIVPFLTSKESLTVALHKGVYDDADFYHGYVYETASYAAISERLWLDAGFDGFDKIEDRTRPPSNTKSWYKYHSKISGFNSMGDAVFWNKPDAGILKSYLWKILDDCHKEKPLYITVPQLPCTDDASRNKMNRMAADLCGQWKAAQKHPPKLILPILLTHPRQYMLMKDRKTRIANAAKFYDSSNASGYWVVDLSLDEENTTSSYRDRIKSLIDFHDGMKTEIATNLRIAGPYWGVNLLLWATGRITHPAVGIGFTTRHMTPGILIPEKPKFRLCLKSLRRIAKMDGLKKWLQDNLSKLEVGSKTHAEFEFLIANFEDFNDDKGKCRRQISRSYRKWFNAIEGVSVAGRKMALFQDFSAAFALGKNLTDLPLSGFTKHPYATVEPLMMNCL